MKKMWLILVLILALTGVVFAANDADVGNFSPGAIANTGNNNTIYGAGGGPVTNEGGTGIGVGIGVGIGGTGGTGGTGGSVTINKGAVKNTNTNTNLNSNLNTNVQDQKQKQQQGQQQGQIGINVQDQFGYVAPVQEVTFISPQQLLGLPSQSIPELNFGNGRMIDATSTLPNFAIYGIKKLGSEMIVAVLSVNANVKFKNLYKAVLEDAKDVANGGKKTLADVRYQVVRAEAQKSWTTGGNLGGGGSGISSSGLGGGSGAGSLIPQWGGTKADDLFTIIFVKVVL